MAKFTIDPDAVQALVVQQLETWVDAMPLEQQNEPFVTAAQDDLTLSPLAILQHVQEGTDLGVQLMQHAAALTIGGALTDDN